MNEKTIQNIKMRMLTLLSQGKVSKTALTMSVRDHNATVRKNAYNQLVEGRCIEACTPHLVKPGRPTTLVRITNKGRKELKELGRGKWQ